MGTESRKMKANNKMRDIFVEKLIVNCNVGESGDKLTKAARVVEQLTGQTPQFGRGHIHSLSISTSITTTNHHNNPSFVLVESSYSTASPLRFYFIGNTQHILAL